MLVLLILKWELESAYLFLSVFCRGRMVPFLNRNNREALRRGKHVSYKIMLTDVMSVNSLIQENLFLLSSSSAAL